MTPSPSLYPPKGEGGPSKGSPTFVIPAASGPVGLTARREAGIQANKKYRIPHQVRNDRIKAGLWGNLKMSLYIYNIPYY
jgi:hypothetical protein